LGSRDLLGFLILTGLGFLVSLPHGCSEMTGRKMKGTDVTTRSERPEVIPFLRPSPSLTAPGGLDSMSTTHFANRRAAQDG
jgi:hypothetical protein